MKKINSIIIFFMILALACSTFYVGCKSDDEPSGPSDKAQAYSSQKEPFSRLDISVTDPGNSSYYVVEICLEHNDNRGTPDAEVKVFVTTSRGSFDQNNDVRSIELTTSDYVRDKKDCVTTFLYYYGDDQGLNGIINAQTNYGDGANPFFLLFGDEITPGSQYSITFVNIDNPYPCGNGMDSSVITFYLSKNAVPVNNASVDVSTTMGCLSNSKNIKVITDANGNGTVTLFTDSVFNDMDVTTTFNYTDGTDSETQMLSTNFQGPGWYFDPLTADGQSQPTVTAHLLTCNLNNAPDDQRITFTTTNGSFIYGGQEVTLSTVNGRASVGLTSDEDVYAIVEARYDAKNCDGSIAATIYSSTLGVYINSGATPTPTPEPYNITISTADSQIGGDTRHYTTVTATVYNSSRTVEGLRIKFETDGGGCLNPEFAYTNSYGIATTSMQSGLALTDNKTASVKASFTDEYNISYHSPRAYVGFMAPGFTLKVSPGNYVVSVSGSTMIAAHLSDYDDADVENANITFAIQSNRGSFDPETELKTATLPTDSNGDSFVSLTSDEVGQVTVTISYNPKDCDGSSTESLKKTLNITFN